MDQKNVIEALQKMKTESKKRKFNQRVDLIVNLKHLNLKKADDQVDFYAQLPHSAGKKKSVCALVGPELFDEAKVCDEVIRFDDFPKYQSDKKLVKQLTEKHDFFIAQADIMAKVAQVFGRVLGPRGKMPNPKAGCVVPPKASIKPIYDRLQLTQRVSAKTQLIVQAAIGNEDMEEAQIAENAVSFYDQIVHHLPLEKNNIRSVFIKMTMTKPEKLE